MLNNIGLVGSQMPFGGMLFYDMRYPPYSVPPKYSRKCLSAECCFTMRRRRIGS